MPIEILMPALSPTMEEGTLAKWLVKEGDAVASGDLLAEIETDKATMEFEAVDEGIIGKLLVAEGTENVAVNSAIAVLLEDGDSSSEVEAAPSAPAQSGSGRSGAWCCSGSRARRPAPSRRARPPSSARSPPAHARAPRRFRAAPPDLEAREASRRTEARVPAPREGCSTDSASTLLKTSAAVGILRNKT